MTTTDILPAGITQLAEPCWELPSDDRTHYSDEQTAMETAEDDPELYGSAKPTPMSAQCWTAQAACGKWVDCEEFQVAHHLSADDALAAATGADFEVLDGVLRCEDGDLCEAKP